MHVVFSEYILLMYILIKCVYVPLFISLYTFKYNKATKQCEAKIKVLATRDFVKDGDKTHTLEFRPIATSSTQKAILPWAKHQLSPIQVSCSKAECYVLITLH